MGDDTERAAVLDTSTLDADVRRHFPRNAAAFIVFDCIWTIGCGFILLAPTVPSYLTALHASGMVMQLATLAIPLLTGLQLWSGAACGGPTRLRKLFWVWLAFPGCWMAYGLGAALGWGRMPEEAFVALFVAASLGLGVTMHLGQPAYGELVLDCTPLRWRGRLAAIRSSLSSLCGLGGVWLAATLKDRWQGMDKFHFAMIVGAGFMAVSCASMLFMRDSRPRTPDRSTHPSPVGTAMGLVRSRAFRSFLIFYGLLFASLSLAPLLVRHGLESLRMQQEGFTGAALGGNLAVAMIAVPLADRFGFRLLGIIAAALAAAAFGVVLAAGTEPAAVLTAYACWGGAGALAVVVLANLGSELAPGFAPSTVIAAGMVLAMPLSLGVAPAGGLLVDSLGAMGYSLSFAGGIALGLCALGGFLFAIREPRSRRGAEIAPPTEPLS